MTDRFTLATLSMINGMVLGNVCITMDLVYILAFGPMESDMDLGRWYIQMVRYIMENGWQIFPIRPHECSASPSWWSWSLDLRE